MMQSGRCINCKVVCNTCRRYRPYVKAHRDLPDIDSDLCSICGRPYLNDKVDIDTYYLDPMLGHLTWFGSGEDEDVGNFIERHKNDIYLHFAQTESKMMRITSILKWIFHFIDVLNLLTFNAQQSNFSFRR